MKFDELHSLLPLNRFESLAERLKGMKPSEMMSKPDEVCDWVEDYLLYCFASGENQAREELGGDYEPDAEMLGKSVYLKTDGKDFRERVTGYAVLGDAESIIRVADTDGNRVYNDAAVSTAKGLGASYKTWITMEDGKVRDTHTYLDGLRVGIDDDFVTYDGDYAKFPGGFQNVQNNANCRCFVNFSK